MMDMEKFYWDYFNRTGNIQFYLAYKLNSGEEAGHNELSFDLRQDIPAY